MPFCKGVGGIEEWRKSVGDRNQTEEIQLGHWDKDEITDECGGPSYSAQAGSDAQSTTKEAD